jgi:diaminohydroxyphosphoribosylaminopyrimidine deaminase/5-amino-6-(5-phosphoribosylamino)uracil reductase
MAATDSELMGRALALAELGRGSVEPNPMVGAVVARDGLVVGEGWHEKFGQAHAEINALAQAAGRGHDGTLYVTLEPCCHHGKTPPCTDALIRSGIRRVVVALLDPFAEVAGRGVELLRSAGLEVEVGLLEPEARALNAPYLKLIRTGRPWVIAKWAMSLDGKIATRTGSARWISGEAARERVHQLRGRMDGILVGIATALTDDPLLTARPPGPRTPARIVLDSHLRLPPSSQLVRTARDAPVLLVHARDADQAARNVLESAGCECLPLYSASGMPKLLSLLNELGRRRFTNLLVEGGAKVLGSFLDHSAIDEVYAFVAPRLIGGEPAPSAIGGDGALTLPEACSLEDVVSERLGDDVMIHGRVRREGDSTR